MRNFQKTWFVYVALLLAGTASADWSGNIGWASDYYFRGIFQGSSSASGGVDFEKNGFYAGTWAAKVGEIRGDGLEVDGYFGYAGDVAAIDYSIGYTGYFYTGDFDDTYQEVNLSGGYGIVAFDLAFGEYEAFDAADLDYTYYSITFEKNGFYGRYAGFSRDFDGEYLEFGYSTTVAEIDLGVSAILATDDLVGDSNETLVFTIGKKFEF